MKDVVNDAQLRRHIYVPFLHAESGSSTVLTDPLSLTKSRLDLNGLEGLDGRTDESSERGKASRQ